MIVRIVKMTFREEAVADFLAVFDKYKEQIRASEGCHHVSLFQSVADPTVISTYSLWTEEEDLENYRHSDLFKQVWGETKQHFLKRAEAHSYQVLHQLD